MIDKFPPKTHTNVWFFLSLTSSNPSKSVSNYEHKFYFLMYSINSKGIDKQKKVLHYCRTSFVSPVGFEPTTASLEGRCSIQLS